LTILSVQTTVPYTLNRLGVVMAPDPDDPLEALGVLNPGSGRTPDGRLHPLPRIVADGNVSRVGFAEVVLRDGVPVGVERRGVDLAPGAGWERGATNAGVGDPRVTWVPSLGVHVMTYVAFGPLGPRLALAGYGMADAKIGVARLDRTVKPLANLCEDHVTQPPPDPASTADSGWRDDGVRLENATADTGRRRHDRLPP